jgi:hypothetical protein
VNFSFTPQTGNGYPYENFGMGYPMFPTIPNHYKVSSQNSLAQTETSDEGKDKEE